MRAFFKDFSATAAVAGLLAVVVAYAGPVVLIFQAAHLAGLSEQAMSSWIWAVSVGSGIAGVFLSLKMRIPVLTAWSTPGAALLVAMLPGVSLAEAVGAYLASAVIITLVGLTGSLDTIMRRIPSGVCSGMFAGILFSFGTKVFTSIPADPLLGLSMLACFLVFRRCSPRWATAAVMAVGIIVSAASGLVHFDVLQLSPAKPVFTAPSWSVSTILGIGIPLALVTLTGQYMSGMAVLHASGYNVRSNGIMVVTGIFSMLFAPFGAHAINLSALTAAICTGREAHENPDRRYVAGVVCGGLYIIVGIFGTTVISLFAALPSVFVAVLGGLALIGAFTTGFMGVFKDNDNLEAGILAFLVTASGVEWLGLGAPFWGLVLGTVACLVLNARPLRAQGPRG